MQSTSFGPCLTAAPTEACLCSSQVMSSEELCFNTNKVALPAELAASLF